jgi:hypothetical protein
MNLSERVKNILLRPKQEWEVIAGESTSTAELYRNYIILLAAIGPIASLIGMSLIGISMPLIGTFRVPIMSAIASAVVSYILGLVGVYIIAMVIDYLAPTFAAQKNMNQALKLAAYSFTAGWLASIFVIIPALSVLSILGLYSFYLLYTGIPVLMKSPPEKSFPYTGAVVVAAIVIFVIISWIPRAFISYPVMGPYVPGAANETLKRSQEAANQVQEAAKEMRETAAQLPPKGGQMTEEQAQRLEDAAEEMQEAVSQQAAQRKE